jgi:hypothetical protein
MRDLWRGSDPEPTPSAEPKLRPVSLLVWAWGGAFAAAVVSYVVSNVRSGPLFLDRIRLHADQDGAFEVDLLLACLSQLLAAAACVLGIVLVIRIEERLFRREETLRGRHGSTQS